MAAVEVSDRDSAPVQVATTAVAMARLRHLVRPVTTVPDSGLAWRLAACWDPCLAAETEAMEVATDTAA